MRRCTGLTRRPLADDRNLKVECMLYAGNNLNKARKTASFGRLATVADSVPDDSDAPMSYQIYEDNGPAQPGELPCRSRLSCWPLSPA